MGQRTSTGTALVQEMLTLRVIHSNAEGVASFLEKRKPNWTQD